MKADSAMPRPFVAWRAVAFLATFLTISFADRFILSLLVEPIKADLGASDTQIGLLVGTSFAAFYTLFAVPIARLADRANRRNLIFAGALLWNLMTAASAFAENFTTLMICRIGVALGEAVLIPSSLSMIADLFVRERRSLPTSVFLGVGTSGGSAALIIGAASLDLVTTPWIRSLPEIGDMAPWRLTLLFLGVPGILMALFFALVVREPCRVDQAGATQIPVSRVVRHIRDEGRAYTGVFGVSALISILSLSFLAWYPTHLVRTYGVTASEAGYMFGVAGIASTLGGGLLLPAIIDLLSKRGREDGFTHTGLGAVLLVMPLLFLSLTADSAATSLLFAAPAYLIMFGMGIMCTTTVPSLSPARMRAQVAALYLLVANAIGLGIGPALIAILSDQMFRNAQGLGYSLLAVGCVVIPIQIVLLAWSRQSLVKALRTAAYRESGNMHSDRHLSEAG